MEWEVKEAGCEKENRLVQEVGVSGDSRWRRQEAKEIKDGKRWRRRRQEREKINAEGCRR